MKSVEEHLEVILVVFPEVLSDVVHHEAIGLAVVQVRADIQRVRVVQHTDFGVFSRRLAGAGLTLDEAAGRFHVAPRGLIQQAIDDDRLAHFVRGNLTCRLRRGRRRGDAGGRDDLAKK